MVRRAALAALIPALAACAPVGPDYHVPETALVNAPAARAPFRSAGAGTVADPLPEGWWRLYDDPRLDRLVAQALAANTDLRVADANLARALALVEEAGARRQVQAGFNGETSWQQRSAEQVLSHVQPPERQLYDAGLSASYDLDLFGGIRRGIEAASAEADANRAARDLVRVNVAAETARAWADLCNAGWQLALMRQVVTVQEADVVLARELVAAGRAADFEARRPDTALAATQAGLPGLAARQRNAALRLAVLTGTPPAEADPGWLDCAHPLTLASPLPVGDGQALLSRRPDIRLAERRLAADTARIGVATAALYPDIRLSGAIGSTGATADGLSPLTNRFAIGPQISWTLNRTTVRARIAGSRAQADADLAAFDGTVLKALREVATALNTYGAARDRQADLERARTGATQIATRTRQLQEGGRANGIALLLAEREELRARQAVAVNEEELNADQIALFLALGGGWRQVSPAS